MPPNSTNPPKFDAIPISIPEAMPKCPQDPEPQPTDHDPTPTAWQEFVVVLKRHALAVCTFVAVAAGFGLGWALRPAKFSARQIQYISFPGELLLRMLHMLILPLVVSSVITGMTFMEKRVYGKMAIQAFCYYIGTTLSAIFTGIILVLLIQPGKSRWQTSLTPIDPVVPEPTVDALLDLIRNMFPSSLVEACFRRYKTFYSKPEHLAVNMTNTSGRTPIPGTTEGANILGLVVFCIGFGLVLGSLEGQGRPLRDLFDCLNTIVMRLVGIVIWYSPVGIFFLVGGQVMELEDIGRIGQELALYMLCVITGLLIHSFITLPMIYLVVTRKNPYIFIGGLLHALAAAFGTASSSATLPITIQCLQRNSMDKRVMRFMLPLGATMTMDGTALYQAVAALFIAQLNNLELNLSQITVIIVTATVSAIGTTGIPQAGMVTIVIVLTSVGLPTEGITFILAVDWMLDRLRTTTTVLGDCFGVGVVQHLSRDTLDNLNPACEYLVEESQASPTK